ncbi:MAG: hypothetical protein LBE38_09290 [Deltaproteobacteria bacterium]|jgi:DNA polymerase III gamma/tau subunit|nr:hypothetical protein [Deltaproteobacteria bacterium]
MPWQLLGAQRAKESLEGMLKRGRLPHALLFTGPYGGGKFTMALDIVKAANCENPDQNGSPCQKCISCRKIGNKNFPDLTILVPQGRSYTHPIEDVRLMRDYLAFKPYEGKTKSVIIKEADKLSGDSGGALLKTLEEPTPNTLLVLTAISASRVMETLVSRCLTIKIPSLTRPELLKAIEEQKGLTGPKAELIGGLSSGALGMALELDAEEAYKLWNQIADIFGAPKGTKRLQKAAHLADTCDTLYKALKAKDDLLTGSARDYLNLLYNSLRLWFRDAAVLAATGEASLLEGPPPNKALKSFAASLSLEDLHHYERSIFKLSDNISRSIRSDLVFENFWLDVIK